MNKSGLLGLSLLLGAVALMPNCGGSDSNDNGNKAGSTGKAGSGSGGSPTGGSSAGGTSNNNTSGTSTNNTSGTGNNNTSGTGNNNNSAGDNGGPGNNNNGGDNGGPGNNAGGNGPGIEACAADVVTGGMCTRAQNSANTCTTEAGFCTCRRGQGQNAMSTWRCTEIGGGAGGAGFGGDVDCPPTKPAAMAACTGTGFCQYAGGGCACLNGTFNCF
jgi:hypothetical protein